MTTTSLKTKQMKIPIDTIIHDDVLRGLKKIPDNSVSLVFTSPPYNVDIPYGEHHNDKMPYEEYLKWLKAIFEECYRVLKPGGRMAINIDAMYNKEEDSFAEDLEAKRRERFRPIIGDLQRLNEEIGFNWRTDICWDKQNVVGKATAWGSVNSCSCPNIRRRHEYILIWNKGPWKLEPTVPESKSDLVMKEFVQWSMSYWPIQPETTNRGGHPVPFPVRLARRVIKMFCFPGDIVLDPFCGSGTTCVTAYLLKRRYIGIELAEKWVEYSNNRIDECGDMFEEMFDGVGTDA